ncbi:pentapeptide repeat-containing protein [Micromonospora tulbaghiae]|uniref:pentapeptide repeat-containing protein n=1 Tax=Micromonospora tulbaghiae TaxID=479978 RepID=UPI0033C0FAE6
MELHESQDPSRANVRVTVGSIPGTGSPVPELRLWGIRWSIFLAVGAALLLVGGLITAALWYGDWPRLRRDATVTAATLFDLLKLVFAVVAGIGGVAALVVAYRRQRVAEHANALAEFAHQLAHAADLRAEGAKALAEAADERAKIETDRNGVRLFNERFAKAAEQLGSEKAAVRLAGAYAMAGLADDWMGGRQTCIDVLCAYLRMPYATRVEKEDDAPDWVGSSDPAAAAQAGEDPGADDELRQRFEEREVRHTIIRLISAHLRVSEQEPDSWRGHDLDFTGVVFDGGDFSHVKFAAARVSFESAKFCAGEVVFDGADFAGGQVSFDEAAFLGGRVSFVSCVFSGAKVSFSLAKFTGGMVHFNNSNFHDGQLDFLEAEFSGALVSMHSVKFSGARVVFDDSTFGRRGPSFSETRFSGGEVSFDWVDFSEDVSFERAKFSGGRVTFCYSQFRKGLMSFDGAIFSGSEVSFSDAIFPGGRLSFVKASLQVPPKLDRNQEGQLPAAVAWPSK